DLLDAERFIDRHVLPSAVPYDSPVPAVAERGKQHDAGLAQVRADGRRQVFSQAYVGQHDVGVVGRTDESDPDEAAYRAVSAVAADHVVGPLSAAATGPGDVDLNARVVLLQPDNLRAVDDFRAE